MTTSTDTSPPEVTDKPMTQAERAELRRIINGRFEVLQQELNQKERDIEYEVEKMLLDNHKENLSKAKKKIKALEKRAKKLVADGKEVKREIEEELGLTLVGGYHGREEFGNASHSLVTAGIKTQVTLKAIDEQVRKAVKQIKVEKGAHALNLQKMKLDIDEQLAITGIRSGEGRDFLAKVPTAEKLLPDPKEAIKLLEN